MWNEEKCDFPVRLLVCVSYCWSLCFLPWLFYCYESLDIYKMYLICRNPGLDWNNNLRHDFDSGPLWCFSALWPDQVFPLKTLKHSHWGYYWMCSTEICECRWCCGESRQSADEDDMRPFFITSLLSKPRETPQCIIRYFLYVNM